MNNETLEWDDLWHAMEEPDRWQPTTEGMFYAMLEAVPPAAIGRGAFLVGEATADNASNEAIYACFRAVYGEYEARYMNEREFATFLAMREITA